MPGEEFNIASQAGGQLLGQAQSIMGMINYAKTSKIAAELGKRRPKLKDSGLADADLSLAESELAGGMSARAENAYKQQNDKQFASSLEAILRSGGSVNNVGDLFGSGQEGRLRLSQLQDQLRLKQIDNLVRARRYKDEQSDKLFMVNEYAPWKDKTMANAEARQGALNDVWSGLQTSVGASSNALSNAGGWEDSPGGKKSNESNGFINPSMSGDDSGLSYQTPTFNPPQNQNNYNWYQPPTGNQPRVPVQRQAQDNNDLNEYNYDYLDDPLWWQGGHNMYGG